MASEPPGPYGIGSDTWPGLAMLAADAAEVVRVVRAIMGNGNGNGVGAASLRESLQEELGDLRAAIDYVIGKNALDWDAVNRRRDRRRSLCERAATDDRHASRDRDAAGGADPGLRGPEAAGAGYLVPCQHARLATARPARPVRRAARVRASARGSAPSPD